MATDRDIAFPTLAARDIAALSGRGRQRDVRAGEVLFAEGDRNIGFFVVLDGGIEILEHSRGAPHTVVVHQQGEFTAALRLRRADGENIVVALDRRR